GIFIVRPIKNLARLPPRFEDFHRFFKALCNQVPGRLSLWTGLVKSGTFGVLQQQPGSLVAVWKNDGPPLMFPFAPGRLLKLLPPLLKQGGRRFSRIRMVIPVP